jgi:hypothetical protein
MKTAQIRRKNKTFLISSKAIGKSGMSYRVQGEGETLLRIYLYIRSLVSSLGLCVSPFLRPPGHALARRRGRVAICYELT